MGHRIVPHLASSAEGHLGFVALLDGQRGTWGRAAGGCAIIAALRALPNLGEGPILWLHRQQPKGGDPVSHCLSPRSPAFVNWILASAEVLA
jgi:hypothetical protein